MNETKNKVENSFLRIHFLEEKLKLLSELEHIKFYEWKKKRDVRYLLKVLEEGIKATY